MITRWLWVLFLAGPLWASQGSPQDPMVSLRLSHVSVALVIEQLAMESALDILLIEPVETPVTLQVIESPVSEVLALLDAMTGLESRLISGTWIVANARHWNQLDQSQPLVEHTFTLAHRDVIKVGDWIDVMMTPRGLHLIDEVTNQVWVRDTQATLDRLNEHFKAYDQPQQQVLIESRIVIANRDFNRALGIQFGIQKSKAEASDTTSAATITLPVNGATGAINLALLSSPYRLDAELGALEASGQGRVISTPRILVANRAEASIQQGVAVPFEAVQNGEGGQGGAVSVQFREAVLALKAQPVILQDGRIQLDLNITQDTVGQIFQTGRGGSVPSIDTRQLSTRVWVSEGQTLVLGGIFQEQDNQLNARVPGLSALPGIGKLFERNNREDQRRELLIFITPTLFTQ